MSQKAPCVGTLLQAAGAHSTRYVGFDEPECLALTAWYVKTGNSQFENGMFGEQPSPHELAKADAEPAAITSCVRDIARMSRGHVLFVGSRRVGKIIMGQAVSGDLVIEPMPWLPSEWNDQLMAAPDFVETLFRTP